MSLLILIALAIVFYTLFDVFASQAGNRVDANLSSIIFNGLGALLPLVIWTYLRFGKGAKLVATTTSGVAYSLAAGVAIAIFSILLIKIFERGGLSYVIPLIYGGSIVLASLIGWTFFKESVSLLQGAGIAVITLGIAIVVYAKSQVTA